MINYSFSDLLGIILIFIFFIYFITAFFKGLFYDIFGIFSGRKNAFYHYHYHYRDRR
jgi:hypothetical protein